MARILVRADATPAMGTGHVMRCLALVEALQGRGHACRFAMAEVTPALAARLAERGLPIDPLPGPAGSPADLIGLRELAVEADAVVIDGYHFPADYRIGLAQTGRIILAWDDGGAPVPLAATLVVNGSSAARPADYALRAPGATLLLGPAYLPLRRDIRDLIGVARSARGHLLVSFGGSDPRGLTAPVIAALAEHIDGRIEAVLGGSVADPGPALATAAAFPDRVRLHRDTPHMAALMHGARLAVSAAGGTLAELAALRVPALLVAVADNQLEAIGISAGHGWAVALDGRTGDVVPAIAAAVQELWNDEARLDRMSRAAQGLVDGGGPDRLADAIEAAMR